jgi:hypothetical protein
MKRTALALTLTLVLLMAIMFGVQFVTVVEANPFFMFDYIDPIPGAIPPTITISNPQNSTVYSSDIITVSLNISKPQQAGWISSITEVEYSLDNHAPVRIYYYWWSNEGSGTPEFNTIFSLYLLSPGQHSLTVKADAAVRTWTTMEIFWIRGTSTTIFTAGAPIFRVTVVIASMIFAVVGVGLFIYFKKRKYAKTTNKPTSI